MLQANRRWTPKPCLALRLMFSQHNLPRGILVDYNPTDLLSSSISNKYSQYSILLMVMYLRQCKGCTEAGEIAWLSGQCRELL